MVIAGLGRVVLDRPVLLEAFPKRDTKHPALESWEQVGGPVPMALATAARRGCQCRFLGCWGDDAAGDFIEGALRDQGLDLAHCQRQSDAATAAAQVWIDARDGDRTIAYTRGTVTPPEVDQLDEGWFANCAVLHLDGWGGDAAVQAARLARAAGAQVVLDAGSIKPATAALLPLTDVLVASRQYTRQQIGDVEPDTAGPALLDLGPKCVVVTAGAAGATAYVADGRWYRPAVRVEVVDTTGAGDVFCGALCHGLAAGWPWGRILREAATAAAASCTVLGNATRVANPDQSP